MRRSSFKFVLIKESEISGGREMLNALADEIDGFTSLAHAVHVGKTVPGSVLRLIFLEGSELGSALLPIR